MRIYFGGFGYGDTHVYRIDRTSDTILRVMTAKVSWLKSKAYGNVHRNRINSKQLTTHTYVYLQLPPKKRPYLYYTYLAK